MNVTHIPANEYRRERWKNGLGWTREVLRWPESTNDWDWRLSIAEVDKSGPFSSFPGVERELVLLHGEGMRLDFEDGESVELMPPHGRHRFAGERALQCELSSGPTQDFNLMLHRRGKRHDPNWEDTALSIEPSMEWALKALGG